MKECIATALARIPEVLQLIDTKVASIAIVVSLGLIACYYALGMEWDTVPRLAVQLEEGVCSSGTTF